jgi:hypothetical protein
MIKIIYNSPAMPQYPYDVKVGMVYKCEKSGNKYFVKGLNFKREFSLNFIQRMFKLCDGYSWDMLEKNKKKYQSNINAAKKPQITENYTKS